MKHISLFIVCLFTLVTNLAAQIFYKCPLETIVINGNNYSEPGMYNVKYTGSLGQDSIVQVTIIDYESYYIHLLRQGCKGYEFMDQKFYEDRIITMEYKTIHGCDSIITIQIDIIDFEGEEIKGNDHLCIGDSLLLSAGFYPQYLWNNGDTTRQIIIDSPQEVSLILTNFLGCKDTIYKQITQSTFDIEYDVTDVACKGDNSGMFSVADYDIPYGLESVKSVDSEGLFYENLISGAYSLQIMDGAQCIYYDTIVVSEPEMSLELELVIDQLEFRLDEEVIVTLKSNIPLIFFDWAVNRNEILADDELTFRIEKDTYIEVTAKDAYGCIRTIDTLIITQKLVGILVPNVFSPNDDGVNDVFFIESDNYFDALEYVRIRDRYGNIIFIDEDFESIKSFMWDGSFNGQKVKQGNYLIEIVYSYRGERLHYNNIITVI